MVFIYGQYILLYLYNKLQTGMTPRAHACVLAVLLVCFQMAASLHAHNQATKDERELQQLIGMQEKYAQGIRQLNSQYGATSQLGQRIAKSNNTQEQVGLLEKAIGEERAKLSQLEIAVVPDSTSVGAECQFLKLQDQEVLSDKLDKLNKNIQELESLLGLVPKCDQVDAIREQLNRMKRNSQQVTRVISNQCQQRLLKSSQVYQTNLYKNDNWVLGSYSMDQLIQEFYDRGQKYSNITNCPVDRPFLQSGTVSESINNCVKCPETKPYFDVSIKICVSCAQGQSLNATARNCQYPSKNSNFTCFDNYILGTASNLPAYQANLQGCPCKSPYFDGRACVSCPILTNYWNVQTSRCQACPAGEGFSTQKGKCLPRLINTLTRLDNTQWITNDGNITRILAQRNKTLQQNKTSKDYKLCNESSPYFDNVTCISCPKYQQFNLDTLKCTLPVNSVYDKNMRMHVAPDLNVQTDPKAHNYISEQEVKDDSTTRNCNESHPFYDGIACIYCQQPLPIFNIDTKQCTKCDDIFIYDDSQHKCVARPRIYVKGSNVSIMTTDSASLADYNKTLQTAIHKHPDAIATACEGQYSYAAVQTCVSCDPKTGSYFNVETLACANCDGELDSVSLKCKYRVRYLLNINGGNIIVPDDSNLTAVNKTINDKLAQGSGRYQICPLDRPYPYNASLACGKCSAEAPQYGYLIQSCTYCPQGQTYDKSVSRCRYVAMLTNYNNTIITPPLTLEAQLQKQAQLSKTNLTRKCSIDKPYTADNFVCLSCSEPNPYFDIQQGLCVACPAYSAYEQQRYACVRTYYLTNMAAARLLEVDNYTVAAVTKEQQAIKANKEVKFVECPADKPYGEAIGCSNCSSNVDVFNLKSAACERCPQQAEYWPSSRKCYPITYFSDVASPVFKYIQTNTSTLKTYQASIDKLKQAGPTRICPSQTPIALNNTCSKCPLQLPYFNIQTSACQACDNFQPATNSCPEKPRRYPNMTRFQWIVDSSTPDQYINRSLELKKVATGPVCPAFYDEVKRNCLDCDPGYYYNVDKKLCFKCTDGQQFDINVHTCGQPVAAGSFFTNIGETPKELQIYGGLTFDELNTTQNQQMKTNPSSKNCPRDRPFFDLIQCVKCPEYKKYFNLRHSLCQVCLTGQTLVSNNCVADGKQVWQKPEAELVYKFLFSQYTH